MSSYLTTTCCGLVQHGVSHFSEGETLAQGLILEYDPDGNAVGVVLTRSALERLRNFLDDEHVKFAKAPNSHMRKTERVSDRQEMT